MSADGAGAGNCPKQGADASAQVEGSLCWVKRQLVDELDASGVYGRCPPLLVGPGGRRVVGVSRLTGLASGHGPGRDLEGV